METQNAITAARLAIRRLVLKCRLEVGLNQRMLDRLDRIEDEAVEEFAAELQKATR